MHILLVISSLQAGGAERVLSDLANYWASKNETVTLVTLENPNVKPFYPLHANVTLLRLNQTGEGKTFLGRLLGVAKRIICLRRVLKATRPEVIISFVDVMNLTTLLAAVKLKAPVIVSERTHPAYHYLPKLYRGLRYLLYPKAFKVVLQTTSSTGYFKTLSNLAVIPNGVREPLQKREQRSTCVRSIISVGRLCPFKGFETLICAFSRLHKEYSELKLTIYGEGSDRERLERLIHSLQLQESVLLPGVKQDIDSVLKHADLFVFPSHYEGFPNALCEAMAMGLPVIASDCSGNIDILQEGIEGRFFPVGDLDKLTQIMRSLLQDQVIRDSMGQQAQNICKRLSFEKIFKRWDDLILDAQSLSQQMHNKH